MDNTQEQPTVSPVEIHSDNLQTPQSTQSQPSVTPGEVQQAAIETEQVVTGEIVTEKPKHPGGRPSKYNEEMLKIAQDYYARCCGKIDGKKRMPFMEELAMDCGVNDDTLYEWMSLNEEFSETIRNLKNLQKLRIIQQGFGAKNPTFSIFMLKVNHDMIETEKRILAGEKNSEPMQVTITDYKSADKQQITEGVTQQVIEEGTE